MRRFCLLAAVLTGFPFTSLLAEGPDESKLGWPQFRGLQGSAAAADQAKLPAHFGPNQNLVWQTPLPSGNSSPCICKDRIFVTACDKTRQVLETLCLDRQTGKILWRQSPPAVAKLEVSQHPVNGPATPTPAADGEAVYVYFGSYGLLAYDFAGKEKWHKPLPPPGIDYSSGSSPIVAGDLVLLTCQGKQSCLLAVQRQTGVTVWKTGRPRYIAGYSTPLLRQAGSTTEVILAECRGAVAYNLKDGAELWRIGFLGSGIPSLASGDGLLFALAHLTGGDPEDRLKFPPFDELLKQYDTDKDGQLSKKEVPGGLVFFDRGTGRPVDNILMDDLFDDIDKNGDGKISRQEWETAEKWWANLESALIAFRPGGTGELRQEQVVWKATRSLPEATSPLYYRGQVYLVKDGGLVSCLEASTGKLLYRQRLGAGGLFYASPVAGDGKIYAASSQGVVVVFEAGPGLKVLARNSLGEAIVATPALVDGRIYVRTEGHLYAFGE